MSIRKHIFKKTAWIFSLVFVLGPLFSGCGIFRPPLKDGDGYYTEHFHCCGPVAIENALAEYNKQAGIANKRRISSKEISKQMQDDGVFFKRFLSLLYDREVVCSTWSWEIENLVEKHGFKLVSVKDFKKLDPSKDIAFVLVRGRFISKEWHWMCYPVDEDIETFFGPKTKINKILLLKLK